MPARSLIVVALLLAPAAALAQTSPYAGQETRTIKALSAEDVDGLLQGKGMALAKAAELNGYPGPPHALDLAAELALSPEQIATLKDIQARMTAAAKPLGAAIVEAERALDRRFAERRIDRESLAEATAGIGKLWGELRAVHLAAHLETRAALSGEQIARYDALRGYTGNAEQHPGHGHHGKHGG
ncbi:Spy/CpxP family protein refolding chaperone [Azospirillum sp. TSO22-1]|uniref:Spy/CpxP family protein refolding chaperone n=1 Tax=Azospirillum sp. TSO22-1 TaxID=716789 RepID=UPI000D61A0AF|nr:Spy/CpxP family protein refolding chaperone [Azospirillum sp. TSO22-1]PWC53078.1 hypothetical protein TSO221_11770 [Azospirillum sp. TSO22-1]